jgi:hypothetical protein
MKLHILSYLTDNVRRFGPLTLRHVEASEKANGAVREAYTRTNRSESAGNQVANHFSIREALRSFLKFGEFYHDNQGRIIRISKGLEELKNLRLVKKVLSRMTYIHRGFFNSYRNQVVYRQDKWFEVSSPTGKYDSFGKIILRPSNRLVDVANENELEPLEFFSFCSQHRTYDGSCCDTFDAVGNYYRIGHHWIVLSCDLADTIGLESVKSIKKFLTRIQFQFLAVLTTVKCASLTYWMT